ncbi:MAG: SDR family NAD(P)-dependent oxidoreductase [Anaerolineales bacterium]
MQLKDKVALVTGSARRVGRDIALELAEAGAHIIIHYHASDEAARETVAAIAAKGVRALAVHADLQQPAEIEELFTRTLAEFGGVDVLVNSASIMERGDLATLPLPDWQRSLDLNLTAPFLCAQYAARSMQAREGRSLDRGRSLERGVIVNITDGSALRPYTTYPTHSVSKAGLVMLTQVLAKAFAPHIRVNAVSPGPVMKPDDMDEAQWARLVGHTLLKRSGSGYDVARAVRFLIVNDFITGETLVVDGGERFR